MNQHGNFLPGTDAEDSFITQQWKSAGHRYYSNNNYDYIVTNNKATAMLLQNGSVAAWESSNWDGDLWGPSTS
ncbi:hypothetical protein GPY51_12185 [Photorhabdus laumondii subsp. laumondii]|uniref:Uncharacterized protein n=1 Tax=Photorhabdus laumondii subsp. laumondii TaxID=141679 RepID=A0A6L9JNZ3_PHOLM|nr:MULTISPECIES: hypothetical protein [Photorhabdus]AWK40358.1 hypothetical protein A4R40_01895 [Photorhabdus laumondii subsp. laumondii]AXG41170.1 hypothetical protein PluDJC_01895 [Photorhabdus laumondii subsp. laumondii]AXG45699.1 hypothetical protein PluTT01m_01970 [Photorhabdus laumondii subsp. laumondii]MCC8383462.1 hypothetical protein [Photorhabdus laumondii]MCC8388624.1 hypothetical protein [Photorhabdus laumondii]